MGLVGHGVVAQLCAAAVMVSAFSFAPSRRKDVFVSDGRVLQKSYRLEDFFWTGSGDGPVIEDSYSNETETGENVIDRQPPDVWRTTTVFHTTTILFATVYPNKESCTPYGCTPEVSPVWTESVELSSPIHPSTSVPDIRPTPTQSQPGTSQPSLPPKHPTSRPTTTTNQAKTTNKISSTSSTTSKTTTTAKPTKKTELEIQEPDKPTSPPSALPDQRYWILTVLRTDAQELQTNLLEDRLSSLYRKAFIRQQEKHLGINNVSLASRQRRERRIPEPVRVNIHNQTRSVSHEQTGLGLLYSVTVAGKPVPAVTASSDMRLLTLNEVSAELGYPIITKAEPYLKGVVPVGARVKGRTRDTWLLIGSVVAAVSLLIILAALFTLGLSKNRTRRGSRGAANRRHVFEGEEGTNNLGYQEDSDAKGRGSAVRPHYAHPKLEELKGVGEGSVATSVTFAEDQRRGSTSSSSCSGSSEASLVRLRHQQRRRDMRRDMPDGPKPRPRTRVRRVDNGDNVDAHGYRSGGGGHSASSAVSRDTLGGMTTEGFDGDETSPHRTRTPTSYLSMPSVKAFPRGARVIEPLNRVLEPVSMRHLDADMEKAVYPSRNKAHHGEFQQDLLQEATNVHVKTKGMTRHGSLEGDDPGVIGPVVWDRHCQKMADTRHGPVGDEHDVCTPTQLSMGRMRRRFNELLDDAFSMFGSRSGSPEDTSRGDIAQRTSDNGRVHSAIVKPVGDLLPENEFSTRPKTTDSKRPQTAVSRPPRGAWDSPHTRTPPRPVSAAPFQRSPPYGEKALILVDSDLPPSDPAVPLIAAIKDELKKFDCSNRS